MLVVLVALMFVPMTNTSAEDTWNDAVPIMEPEPDADPMAVAVYFADNMVFTPQWRLGNFIRIEIMILDADCSEPSDILIDETDMTNIEGYDPEDYDQQSLRDDPDLLKDTNMISVSEIWINIISVPTDSNPTAVCVASWHSDFKDKDPDAERTVIREINGEGHLIYGGKWDTSSAPYGGEYTVSVGLPGTYNIKWAVQHDRGVEEETAEEVAVLSEDSVVVPPEPIGYMLVPNGDVDPVTHEAYIVLGELLDGGGSGTNGGGDVAGGNGPAYQGGGVRRR
ncbi:MAG: hypothetical protein WBC49_05915 [Thermoplasmata archaeon]